MRVAQKTCNSLKKTPCSFSGHKDRPATNTTEPPIQPPQIFHHTVAPTPSAGGTPTTLPCSQFVFLSLCSSSKKKVFSSVEPHFKFLQQKQIIFGRFHHSVINRTFGVFVHCLHRRLVIVFLQPIVQMLLGRPAGQY